ncbi:hypothetical protein AXA88_27290 [Salmonella enterica]|nr:hypothetical protein [Salmonella enterica]EAX3609517.1 hypothetical protein [Salmonella enterica]EGW6283069.1 hypothetical protein [Salmonella enterica]EGX3935480.1 hypothetical protein [Salmonella enterica]
MKKDIRLSVIEELAKKYPCALATVPHQVKPIIDDLESEIFIDIGTVPKPLKRGIYSALAWYRTWPVYLTSLISERGKCNLKGEVIVNISATEKIEARNALERRGILTKRVRKLLKAKTGRIDTTNG